MKRKLDANNTPSTNGPDVDDSNTPSFEDLDFDPRLRQALIKENFTRPTLIQAKAIPLALEGKDILGKLFYPLFINLLGFELLTRTSTSTSPCKNRFWKNCRLHSSYLTKDFAEKEGMFIYIISYT